jgi:hypothetical protein
MKTPIFRLPNSLRIHFLILENGNYRLPETLVKYQHTLHNKTEGRWPNLHGGGSLKSQIIPYLVMPVHVAAQKFTDIWATCCKDIFLQNISEVLYHTTRQHIPKWSSLYLHCQQNIKFACNFNIYNMLRTLHRRLSSRKNLWGSIRLQSKFLQSSLCNTLNSSKVSTLKCLNIAFPALNLV